MVSTFALFSYKPVLLRTPCESCKGLFGRGLKTRIFANALQSIVFTVIWRSLAERWKVQHGASGSNEEALINDTVVSDADSEAEQKEGSDFETDMMEESDDQMENE